MDAKPIIDIQISVPSLEPVETYRSKLEKIGYVFRPDNPDLTKRYFRESPGNKRTHIHVREHGSWSEQFALLFRDYLRASAEDRKRYANEKYRLMGLFRNERHLYVENKEPIIWDIMRRASIWSQQTGWKSGKTDV